MEPTKLFTMQILQPTGVLNYKALLVGFPAYEGEIAVLAHHAPFVSASSMGILRILKENHEWEIFFVEGGAMEMDKNCLSFIAAKLIPASAIVQSDVEKMLREIINRHTSEKYSFEEKQKDTARARFMLKICQKYGKA